MVQYFNHHTAPVPLLPPPPCLVLHKHNVGHLEGSEYFGVLSQDSTLSGVSACQSNFSLLSSEQPFRAWLKVLGVDWEEILDWVAKDNLCRTLASVSVRGVAICQQRSQESVSVKISTCGEIFSQHPLGSTDTQLSPLIAMRELCTAQTKVDFPVLQKLLGFAGNILPSAI